MNEAFCFFLFRRNKDGRFAPKQRIELDYPEDKFGKLSEFSPRGLSSQVAVTDWNGDGVPDLLVGGNTRVLGVVYGPLAGKNTLTVERVWPKGKELLDGVTTNLCVADWDGDGLADLIVGGYVGDKRGVYWLRNIGTKKARKRAEPKLLLSDDVQDDDRRRYTTGVWVTDWNADGRPDLIVSVQEWSRVGEGAYGVREHKVWVYLRQGR
ncbi:MAG TPA: VCBS repeat-containing protein [Gemmataceae bacterium]|nr:VCBS repeat-containing protein [Gemmataceae bacterium]